MFFHIKKAQRGKNKNIRAEEQSYVSVEAFIQINIWRKSGHTGAILLLLFSPLDFMWHAEQRLT